MNGLIAEATQCSECLETQPVGWRRRWGTVVVFAIAMAWVEAAVVYYLRTMIDRIEPYQAHPLPIVGGLSTAELIREAATLVMLLSVGVLAGREWRSRIGFAVLAFGIWDIFYYVFLKWLCDWPKSLLDWDILFLLPLPWWGPVLAPVSIAALMIIWGTLVARFEGNELAQASWLAWGAACLGALLALYVFMKDALGAAGSGVEALRNLLPVKFAWPLFALAVGLMAVPIVQLSIQLWPGRRRGLGTREAGLSA